MALTTHWIFGSTILEELRLQFWRELCDVQFSHPSISKHDQGNNVGIHSFLKFYACCSHNSRALRVPNQSILLLWTCRNLLGESANHIFRANQDRFLGIDSWILGEVRDCGLLITSRNQDTWTA